MIASSTPKNNEPMCYSEDSIGQSEKCTVYDEDEQICSRIMCDDDLDKYGSQDRMKHVTNNVSFAHHENARKHSFDDDERGLMLMVPNVPKPMQANHNHNGEVVLSSANHLTVGKPMTNGKKHTETVANKGVLRHSIKNSNYLRNMRIHRNSIHYRGALLSTHRYRLRTSSCPNIYRNSMTTLAQHSDETSWRDSVMDALKSMFDLSLFLNPKFAYFQFSTLLLFVW